MSSKALDFIPGLIGAVVSLRFIRDLSPMEKVTTTLCGAAIAYTTSGLVTHQLGIEKDWEGAVAFLLGLFGLSLTSAIMRGLRKIDLAMLFTSLWSKK